MRSPFTTRARNVPPVSQALLNSVAVQRARSLGFTRDPEPPKSDGKAWYAWYLKTAEWDWRRRAVLRRADYCCEGCGAGDKPLQVHHLTYAHKGRELLWELVAACADCHAAAHA